MFVTTSSTATWGGVPFLLPHLPCTQGGVRTFMDEGATTPLMLVGDMVENRLPLLLQHIQGAEHHQT